jgi:hypothetical protein
MQRVLDPILEGLGELGASDGCCRNSGLISESIVGDHQAAAEQSAAGNAGPGMFSAARKSCAPAPHH